MTDDERADLANFLADQAKGLRERVEALPAELDFSAAAYLLQLAEDELRALAQPPLV